MRFAAAGLKRHINEKSSSLYLGYTTPRADASFDLFDFRRWFSFLSCYETKVLISSAGKKVRVTHYVSSVCQPILMI